MNPVYAWCHAIHKRCSAPFKSVLVLSFFRQKERTAIRALIRPWALGLTYILVRLEKPLGISPVPLNYFSLTLLYSKCFAHFGNLRNHSYRNSITRLFAALSIRVNYSGLSDYINNHLADNPWLGNIHRIILYFQRGAEFFQP